MDMRLVLQCTHPSRGVSHRGDCEREDLSRASVGLRNPDEDDATTDRIDCRV